MSIGKLSPGFVTEKNLPAISVLGMRENYNTLSLNPYYNSSLLRYLATTGAQNVA